MSVFPIFDLQELSNDVTDFSYEKNYGDELSEIMSKYNSDKGYGLCKNFVEQDMYPPNNICHNYTYFYDKLFKAYKNQHIKIFEMGPGSWNGSLLGWKEYFPNSSIFSADFDKSYLYCDERIKSYYVDQENSDSINDMLKNLENMKLDIIIDDGPHTYSSNILFYKNSINKLKKRGLYIIEDVNLGFIDGLCDEIISFNNSNHIKFNIVKLIIPYPKKFTHPDQGLHNMIINMNNLIIIQKK
jgi:hypothetical protein